MPRACSRRWRRTTARWRCSSCPTARQYKDWATLNLIFDRLLGDGSDRKTVLFALGGGVVGDITGFAAACYMRGVPFVQVPTTLLAQVDSSVGGKTAINHPPGKNMIGAFYQPQRVVCDLDTLRHAAAARAARRPGRGHQVRADRRCRIPGLDRSQPRCAAGARRRRRWRMRCARSCEIKAWVVGQDERESGLRAILNFGHTFGHAIEAGLGYGAVAARRGGGLRHGDGGRSVGAPRA